MHLQNELINQFYNNYVYYIMLTFISWITYVQRQLKICHLL